MSKNNQKEKQTTNQAPNTEDLIFVFGFLGNLFYMFMFKKVSSKRAGISLDHKSVSSRKPPVRSNCWQLRLGYTFMGRSCRYPKIQIANTVFEHFRLW